MKTYRIYYNREADWPQCWSVDEGDQSTEINVTGFDLRGVRVTSRTLPRGTVVARRDTPFAWLEVAGELELYQGVAIIGPARRRSTWRDALRAVRQCLWPERCGGR